MIIITGALGFIGSCLISHINSKWPEIDIIAVDDFKHGWSKLSNIHNKSIKAQLQREILFEWLQKSRPTIDFVFHFGARTDTFETNKKNFKRLNLDYSKKIWDFCASENVPLVYASSAATYGLSDHFSDDHSQLSTLKPLNEYAHSKHNFDLWAIDQQATPQFWAGLKLFNVFGPNEYHKGEMASVIFRSFWQAKLEGKIELFKSHISGIVNGDQKRDFIYVKDVLKVCSFLFENTAVAHGIYNVGTGCASSFNELIACLNRSLNKIIPIDFISMPQALSGKYQYRTEADITKLRAVGYSGDFFNLEDSVSDYVQNYLLPSKYF